MADLPIKLQSALETLVSGYEKEKLEKDARAISEAYRLRTGEGKRLLTAEGEAAVLTNDKGQIVSIADYDILDADQAYSRRADGSYTTELAPTPGAANE